MQWKDDLVYIPLFFHAHWASAQCFDGKGLNHPVDDKYALRKHAIYKEHPIGNPTPRTVC